MEPRGGMVEGSKESWMYIHNEAEMSLVIICRFPPNCSEARHIPKSHNSCTKSDCTHTNVTQDLKLHLNKLYSATAPGFQLNGFFLFNLCHCVGYFDGGCSVGEHQAERPTSVALFSPRSCFRRLITTDLSSLIDSIIALMRWADTLHRKSCLSSP